MIADFIRERRSYAGSDRVRDAFLAELYKLIPGSADYLATIKGLPETVRKSGTAWLDGIVQEITRASLEKIPSFK